MPERRDQMRALLSAVVHFGFRYHYKLVIELLS